MGFDASAGRQFSREVSRIRPPALLYIGPHGSPWTPEKARKEAKRLLGLVAGGKDPADERTLAALQATETLRKIADQYLKQAKQKLRPRTYYEIERYLLST